VSLKSAAEPELELEVFNEPVFADAPSHGERDYVALIEAAYDLAIDDGTWLLGIVRAASPILDCGDGVSGHFWDLSQKDKLAVRHPIYVGCASRLRDAHMASGGMLTATQAHATYLAGNPCKVIAERQRHQFPRAYEAYKAHTGSDGFIHVSSADLTRTGCAITAPHLGDASPALHRALAQVTRHIVAGMRLRRSLGTSESDSEARSPAADAVLDSEGRLLHAEPHADSRRERESLIDAVRRLLDSRRARHAQPEHAVELWRALVLGRWSLVDHQDSDGKRFLLARRNAPNVEEPTALKEEERRAAALFALLGSVKLVAYELGLAQSTISEQLKCAARKLGCRDRSELARFLTTAPTATPTND
jgi:DNA-binding CsgD family transcriptional regulator